MSAKVRLTNQEVVNATDMFERIDRNGDGVIDFIEFQAMMEVSATDPRARARRACASLTCALALQSIAHRTHRPHTFEGIRRMFMEADLNADGIIGAATAAPPPRPTAMRTRPARAP